MNTFTYVGILKPTFNADKFMTSIFEDENGNYFTQEDHEEVIIEFKPIILNRELIQPKEDLEIKVAVGDKFVYSFLTAAKQLIYGHREIIEERLLLLINSNMTTQARLLISSFLKLFQKTIDLVKESDIELANLGIKQKLDKEIAFSNTSNTITETNKIITEIRTRYEHFLKINPDIRLEDIAFMNTKSAFFSNYQIQLDKFANRQSLQNDQSNELVSKLIMIFAKKNVGIIRTLLMKSTETADFILGTEYITIEQHDADAPLFNNDKIKKLKRTMSVLETFIRIDKEIHSEDVPQRKRKKAIAEKALWNTFETIIKGSFSNHT